MNKVKDQPAQYCPGSTEICVPHFVKSLSSFSEIRTVTSLLRRKSQSRANRTLTVYIKPGSPHLNGKVERSHRTDKQEFWQLVDYVDDIDIKAKLKEWEVYYNCHRPHAGLKGKAPFEVLREKLQSQPEKV